MVNRIRSFLKINFLGLGTTMTNTDTYMMSYADGVATITDRWSTGHSMPTIDT